MSERTSDTIAPTPLPTPSNHARLASTSTMPAELVDALSTLLAELVLEDLRQHPDLRIESAPRQGAPGR
jgi:hypothetical protein